jgi:hypothetical protein
VRRLTRQIKDPRPLPRLGGKIRGSSALELRKPRRSNFALGAFWLGGVLARFLLVKVGKYRKLDPLQVSGVASKSSWPQISAEQPCAAQRRFCVHLRVFLLSRGKFAFGEVKGRVKVPENTSGDTFKRGDALVRRLAPMGCCGCGR